MDDLKIVYEDNHVIVVVKPKKIPSQQDKTGDIDMLTLVKKYIKEKYDKPGEVYIGLVHRLDRMTEGLMVFAKTSKAASRLSNSIREGDFKKEYMTVICGTLKGKGILEDYLVKDERTNISKIADSKAKNAKLANLEYRVIKNITYKGAEYTYVRVKLNTGRHHQIRAQFSNIGHPILGDIKYGAKKGDLALFACSLKFIHPTKDDVLEFEILPEKTGIWSEI